MADFEVWGKSVFFNLKKKFKKEVILFFLISDINWKNYNNNNKTKKNNVYKLKIILKNFLNNILCYNKTKKFINF